MATLQDFMEEDGLKKSSYQLRPDTPSSMSFKSLSSSRPVSRVMDNRPKMSPEKTLPGTPGRNTPSPTRSRKSLIDGSNVKVIVRVRPLNQREGARGAKSIVRMNPEEGSTILSKPDQQDTASSRLQSRRIEEKTFFYDHVLDSSDPTSPQYAEQCDLYDALGREVVDHSFEGYNTCVFAYGQTGSGKSYSMMGSPESPGLIPRTCQDIFARISALSSSTTTFITHVSYFEIYNEQVRDLLSASTEQAPLKIRESPTEGPYVQNLSSFQVESYKDINYWMSLGNKRRATASTKMNDTSSRSHAVLTLVLKQITESKDSVTSNEKISRIRLVDLAGSERASSTGSKGDRLREGGNINKSLTTLGRVIASLADRKKDITPFRDSTLTWLLKDSLGGNSKTAMVACISPSDYDETLSTLRYADQAKRIRTIAVVNEKEEIMAKHARELEELKKEKEQTEQQYKRQARDLNDQLASMGEKISKAESLEILTESQQKQIENCNSQIEKLYNLLEDQKRVADEELESLRNEKEAIKLHLGLALDSVKMRIPERGNSEVFMKEKRRSVYDPQKMAMYEGLKAEFDELLGDVGNFRRAVGYDVSSLVMAVS